ncbi:AAA family ATPase [Hallella absiana]|uniref:AAA family ATPase n=1 Tax=Hallella absiana TaxID=2925336 RepID=UPI003D229A12
MNDMSNPTSWQKASLIGAELQSAEQTSAGVPTSVGMLSIKSANRTLTEASMTANPKQLYGEFWFEHEIGCLFADSNVGKSILAIQIAEDIAKTGEIVLYFDFELSEKQFQLRFTDEQGNLHHFPSTLYRVQPDMNLIASIDEPFEDALMRNIENVAVETKARILIIDNISILCMQMEKGEDSAALVQRLRTLKNKYGFSILIIAHTPKRNMSMPITQNDLAGSKKLFNFIDSCFAIGLSAQSGNMRYVKQVKVRNCEMRYGGDNVMVCHIEKVGTMVQFINMGTAPEHDHLRMVNREEQVQEARLLSASGLSLRDIASRMGVSKSTVNRMLREVSGVPDGQTGQVGQTGQDGLSQVSQPSHLSNGTAGGNAITCKTNDDGTA